MKRTPIIPRQLPIAMPTIEPGFSGWSSEAGTGSELDGATCPALDIDAVGVFMSEVLDRTLVLGGVLVIGINVGMSDGRSSSSSSPLPGLRSTLLHRISNAGADSTVSSNFVVANL